MMERLHPSKVIRRVKTLSSGQCWQCAPILYITTSRSCHSEGGLIKLNTSRHIFVTVSLLGGLSLRLINGVYATTAIVSLVLFVPQTGKCIMSVAASDPKWGKWSLVCFQRRLVRTDSQSSPPITYWTKNTRCANSNSCRESPTRRIVELSFPAAWIWDWRRFNTVTAMCPLTSVLISLLSVWLGWTNSWQNELCGVEQVLQRQEPSMFHAALVASVPVRYFLTQSEVIRKVGSSVPALSCWSLFW